MDHPPFIQCRIIYIYMHISSDECFHDSLIFQYNGDAVQFKENQCVTLVHFNFTLIHERPMLVEVHDLWMAPRIQDDASVHVRSSWCTHTDAQMPTDAITPKDVRTHTNGYNRSIVAAIHACMHTNKHEHRISFWKLCFFQTFIMYKR